MFLIIFENKHDALVNQNAVMTRKPFSHIISLVGGGNLPVNGGYLALWVMRNFGALFLVKLYKPLTSRRGMIWEALTLHDITAVLINLVHYVLPYLRISVYRRKHVIVDHVDKGQSMGHATPTAIIETIIQLLSHRYTVTRVSCLSHNDVMTWKCFPHYVGHRRTHPQWGWVIQIIDIDCNFHYLYHFPYMNYWSLSHSTFTSDGQAFRNSTPLPPGNALKSYIVCQYPTSAATRDRVEQQYQKQCRPIFSWFLM